MFSSWEATRPNKRRSGGEGPQNSHIQGLVLLFPDWEMLVGHSIPLCFNFPNYKISVFPSLNCSPSELAAQFNPSLPLGEGVGHTWLCWGNSGADPGTGSWIGRAPELLSKPNHSLCDLNLRSSWLPWTPYLPHLFSSTNCHLLWLINYCSSNQLTSLTAIPTFSISERKTTSQPELQFPLLLQSSPSDIDKYPSFSSFTI